MNIKIKHVILFINFLFCTPLLSQIKGTFYKKITYDTLLKKRDYLSQFLTHTEFWITDTTWRMSSYYNAFNKPLIANFFIHKVNKDMVYSVRLTLPNDSFVLLKKDCLIPKEYLLHFDSTMTDYITSNSYKIPSKFISDFISEEKSKNRYPFKASESMEVGKLSEDLFVIKDLEKNENLENFCVSEEWKYSYEKKLVYFANYIHAEKKRDKRFSKLNDFTFLHGYYIEYDFNRDTKETMLSIIKNYEYGLERGLSVYYTTVNGSKVLCISENKNEYETNFIYYNEETSAINSVVEFKKDKIVEYYPNMVIREIQYLNKDEIYHYHPNGNLKEVTDHRDKTIK